LTFLSRGFRQVPFAQRHTIRAGYSSLANGYRAEYDGEFRGTGASAVWSLHAAASELELLRFYGVGNETSDAGPSALYRVRDGMYRAYGAGFGLTAPIGSLISSTAQLFARYSQTKNGITSLLEQERPYGSGGFGVVGVKADAQLDTRDQERKDRAVGFLLDLGGSASPAWWNATSAYGELHGEARTYLAVVTLPTAPTLALRVGGRKGWGDTPFQDLAYLGGGSSPLRGFHSGRFAGQSEAYGNAELRSRLGEVTLILPAQLGVFVLGDAGRVYMPGESSSRWHHAFGGGLWLAFLRGKFILRASAAHSVEGTSIDVRSGLAY